MVFKSHYTLTHKAKISYVILEKLAHELQNATLGEGWTSLHLTPDMSPVAK
jgi:hypothetical protein